MTNKAFFGLTMLIFTLFFASVANAAVVVNEVLANPSGAEPTNEFIELYNDGLTGDVNLSGYRLNNSVSSYVIPDGTVITSNSFLSFDGTTTGLTLDNTADTIYFLDVTNTTLDGMTYDTTLDGCFSWKNA